MADVLGEAAPVELRPRREIALVLGCERVEVPPAGKVLAERPRREEIDAVDAVDDRSTSSRRCEGAIQTPGATVPRPRPASPVRSRCRSARWDSGMENTTSSQPSSPAGRP